MGAMEYGLALYSGVIGTALSVYLINLCINLRDSQFVSSFSPASLIIVTILGWIFTNDIIYLGSLIGSIVLLIGLGVALWGMNGQLREGSGGS
ncbi:hypothetical protein MKW92_004170 [Papaver armeniacum]|nr:hypothetical protein MKW92_004170 [Papaver armeniacum]